MSKNNPGNIESFHLEVKDRSFGFFIYFYDESQGHVLLYSYPSDLRKNESEKSILAIHPAWWHQDRFLESEKFSTMDLELNKVVYSATLFTCKAQRVKRRDGMHAEKWAQERFILIVKSPSEVSFIAQEILQEFYSRIKTDLGDQLCLLVKETLEKAHRPNDDPFSSKETENMIRKLDNICILLTPKTPISALKSFFNSSNAKSLDKTESTSKKQEITSRKKMRFTIPSKTEEKKKRKPLQKILRIISMRKRNKEFEISIKNKSSVTLRNVSIKIYESRGFFGKDKKIVQIDQWVPDESISVNFTPKDDQKIIYLLKIADNDGLIKVKRIEERLDLK